MEKTKAITKKIGGAKYKVFINFPFEQSYCP